MDVTKTLSEIEVEILLLIKDGYTSSEIGGLRNCSTRTIEKHRSNMIKKLGIKSDTNALLRYAISFSTKALE
jgi:DNA-binding NarL/FixJ family response regulator